MNKILYLIIITFALSCQNASSSYQTMLGKKFEIEFGKQITIPEKDIILEFKDVLEDSRCPKGVMCIWAGNAEIVIQLNDKETSLNTYLDPKQATISNYEIKLISVSPYPKYKVDIQKKEYVAELLITKN